MIVHPLVLALLASSASIVFMAVYASVFAGQILRRWDLGSGSELQLGLERKTYLVSTLLGILCVAQILSLFLFVFTADRLHPLFVGAMCAAGTLNVNAFGYPTLLAKLANFVLAGLWLILNRVDNRGYDYPLVKIKYRFLLIMAPFLLAEAGLQAAYFLSLEPAVITSCCASLFSASGGTLISDLAALPAGPMKAVFAAAIGLTVAAGAAFISRGRGGVLFAGLSGAAFVVSLLSILSFVSIYIYELPSHHCPFCVLQKEYHFLGYPLYALLLTGGIAGIGVGMLAPFRNVASLAGFLPAFRRKLAWISVLAFLAFAALAGAAVLFSGLRLAGS